ncbi:MAG TPA: flavin reductase family protein [Actinomycetota bacterium]|nr:flavin reductase family protein [Actinomycetota bacterium]
MAIDLDIYREILTGFPSGVAVVTASGEDDKPLGLTVSAFCAVSLQPPLVLVCIDKASNTLSAIQGSGGFTVNLLAAGREEIALAFAGKADDKFAGVQWRRPSIPQSGPILDRDSVGYAECVTEKELEAGDHWIFVGRVENGASDPEASPLVYGRRQFAAWSDL